MNDSAAQSDLLDYAVAQAAKDRVLDTLEVVRAAWVKRCRARADMLWEAKCEPITVNMIREFEGPPPGGEDPRAFGCLLRKPRWRCIGYTKSDRVKSNSRPVARFVRTV
jgi:hypothetical protein